MGFFACYLLTPVAAPQRLRCTYVGFTVAPTRRIRQHNGELVNGAKRTTKHRPWEMVVVVHGFPTKFHALQFEYAWQHPYICRFTKERMRPLKGTTGLGHPRSVKRKLIELHEMLHVPPWDVFPLTVSYTNLAIQNLVRTTPFFQWPIQMACEIRAFHEFAQLQTPPTTYISVDEQHDGDGDGNRTCYICDETLSTSDLQVLACYHAECRIQCHSLCLADHFLLEMSAGSTHETDAAPPLRPERGPCPECGKDLLWPLLVRAAAVGGSTKTKANKTKKKTSAASPQKRRRGATTRPLETAIRLDENEPLANRSPSPACEFHSDSSHDSGWFEDAEGSLVEYLDEGTFERGMRDESLGFAVEMQGICAPDLVDLTTTDN